MLTAATARATTAAVNDKSCKLASYKILQAIVIYCRIHLIERFQVLTVGQLDILKSSVFHSVVWSSLAGQQSAVNLIIDCWTAMLIYCLPYLHYSQMIASVKYAVKKGKAVPLQAWSGLEGSRKLRFPDFVTTAQDVGKAVNLTHRPPLPPVNTPGTHFC